MDLNTSLDNIIKRKGTSNQGNDSSLGRRRPASQRPSSASPSRPPRHDTRRDRRPPYKSDTTTFTAGTDLRSRIGLQQHRQGDRPHPLDKTDLRGRIGKRASSLSTGLSTSSLPNRQRLGQQRSPFKDDVHSILITKPVYGDDASSTYGKSNDVDPASIVITTKVNQTGTAPEKKQQPASPIREDSPPPPRQESPERQPDSTSQENERSLQQYLQQQQQQEQQLRQQLQLQQQLQSQNQQIMELQRQLSQRTEFTAQHQRPPQPPQPILHQLHHQQHNDPGRHFSFRPMMNEGPPPLLIPPSNRSNTVILSNLDPATNSTDVQISCSVFGPVVRCDLVRDRLGRSCGEAEVEFLEHTSALDCVAKFDNEYVDDRVIRATLRQPYPAMRSVIAPTRSGYRTTSQVLYTDKRS